jgi:hypothetical protein
MKKGIKWLVVHWQVAAIAVIGTTSAFFAAGNGRSGRRNFGGM